MIPRYRPNGYSHTARTTTTLLVGEDAARYDDLFAGIRAAVNPIDTVEEVFVADVNYS